MMEFDTMQKSLQRSAASALPRQFYEIRLELAREAGHPEGSRDHGYRLVAPLNSEQKIDAKLWKEHQDACRVVKFRPGEEDEIGHLVHHGKYWAFHYDIKGADTDEAGYRFADERFFPGEYVSVHEADGMHTFRVTSVEHV